ncbi:hypothetical protein EHW61_15605 [Salinivibrio sp. VYel6]|nr:hypothetical protein [Salinivibrio sp. VYel6]MPX98060.1 hypothetical protein [Salinivibrio sp. VYel6]
MLLSGCAKTTETEVRVVNKLPPAGLVVPCDKPAVNGTWPAVIVEDIPNLKAALSECAGQVEDYLNWREQQARNNQTEKDQ